jgi:hypothetical protein
MEFQPQGGGETGQAYESVSAVYTDPLGIFGTPNYVVNGEIFWGQDRLGMVESRIKELLAAGSTPRTYD